MIRNPTISKLKESFDNNYFIVEGYLMDRYQNLDDDIPELFEVDETDLKDILFDCMLCKLGLSKYTLRNASSFMSRGNFGEDVSRLNKRAIKDLWDLVMVYQVDDKLDPYTAFVDAVLDEMKDKVTEEVFEALETNLTD